MDRGLEDITGHDSQAPSGGERVHEGSGPYGCSMAFRAADIRGLTFDERLPLYAWLEDADFGGQIVWRGGKTARADALWGIHLANKSWREGDVRVGYAQVADPAYLARIGTLPLSFLAGTMLRNVAANAVRALASEPYIDRRVRLKGNLIAVTDVLRGRIDPQRMTQL